MAYQQDFIEPVYLINQEQINTSLISDASERRTVGGEQASTSSKGAAGTQDMMKVIRGAND